jgi:CRP-like cAMP-binding protein
MDTDRLRSIQLFADIPDEDLVQIAPFADEISVEEGKRLVNEGDFAHQFMAIEEGSAEVLRGGEHVADLGPGDFFGEVGLLEKDRRNASVVAKSPMRLITLTGWDLKRLEKAMPQAADQIRRVMEERRAE